MIPITIVIPVGPKPHHRQWLREAIKSIGEQHTPPSELLIVEDGGRSNDQETTQMIREFIHPGTWFQIYHNPCNLGVVGSLNVGVALAKNDHVLLGCADDELLTGCINSCWEAWQRYQEPLGYYYLGVRYSDGREQNTACGAAMVTKQLWEYTGGFPTQASVGAADHIFLSMLIAGDREGYSRAKIIRVSDEVLYWYRVHDKIETSNNIWPAIEAVRDRLTLEWRPRN